MTAEIPFPNQPPVDAYYLRSSAHLLASLSGEILVASIAEPEVLLAIFSYLEKGVPAEDTRSRFIAGVAEAGLGAAIPGSAVGVRHTSN